MILPLRRRSITSISPLWPCRSAAAAGAWSKLTGFEAGRKENVQRASAWAGQRIKQAQAHSAPAAAPLEVFVDPELQVRAAAPDSCGRGVAGCCGILPAVQCSLCYISRPAASRVPPSSLPRRSWRSSRRQRQRLRQPRRPASRPCGSGWTRAAPARRPSCRTRCSCTRWGNGCVGA